MIDLTIPVTCAAFLVGGASIGKVCDSSVQRIYEYAKCTFFGDKYYTVPGHQRFDENYKPIGFAVLQSADCHGYWDRFAVCALSASASFLLATAFASFLLTAAPSVKLALLVGSVALPVILCALRTLSKMIGHGWLMGARDVQVLASPDLQSIATDKLTARSLPSYTYHKFPLPWNDQPRWEVGTENPEL